ncbi:MAG TPA: hypothetical protein VIW46_00955, partial [Acidimicrobiia bacterium]
MSIVALAIVALIVGPAAAALPDGPWSGEGTGTIDVVADGTQPCDAQFGGVDCAIFKHEGVFGEELPTEGFWRFTNRATDRGTRELNWLYEGNHSGGPVFLEAVVWDDQGGGNDPRKRMSVLLVDVGSSPEGFSYTGTVTLRVSKNDSYGFVMTGTSADHGTLTIRPPDT